MPVREPRQRHGRRALHAGTAVAAAGCADAGADARIMTALDRRSAVAIAEAVNRRETSAVAMAAETLMRLAAYDEVQRRIWIARIEPDDLVAAARAIDARIAAGETLPLAGVPYAVKDNIDVSGFETTAACPAYAYLPEGSAGVVERLEAAG